MMKFTFLRYIIYAALTYGLMEFMLFDAKFGTDPVKFAESSFVEQAQNVLLLISLVFLCFTKGFNAVKYLLILVLGMFFIREQDAFLDSAVTEHAWKIICAIFAVLVGFKIFKIRKTIASELQVFMKSAPSGILFLGFTTLLIFSRMFGRKKFWKAIEETEDYTRNVKNAAEECTELFAYFIIMIGVVEFFVYAKAVVKEEKFVRINS